MLTLWSRTLGLWWLDALGRYDTEARREAIGAGGHCCPVSSGHQWAQPHRPLHQQGLRDPTGPEAHFWDV